MLNKQEYFTAANFLGHAAGVCPVIKLWGWHGGCTQFQTQINPLKTEPGWPGCFANLPSHSQHRFTQTCLRMAAECRADEDRVSCCV